MTSSVVEVDVAMRIFPALLEGFKTRTVSEDDKRIDTPQAVDISQVQEGCCRKLLSYLVLLVCHIRCQTSYKHSLQSEKIYNILLNYAQTRGAITIG